MNPCRCGLDLEPTTGGTDCPVCGRLAGMGVPFNYRTAAVQPGAVADALASGNVFLFGGTGRGKTYAACAMLREHVVRQVQERKPTYARFRSLPELLLQLRSTYHRDSETTERDLLDYYSTVRLLVLDDVGAEKTTDAVRSSLYLLIDRRGNDSRLRTVITSNLSLEEIAVQHGQPIASRLAGMCRVIRMTGPDRRLT